MQKVVFFTGLSDKALDIYLQRAPAELTVVPVREDVPDEKAVELVQDLSLIHI